MDWQRNDDRRVRLLALLHHDDVTYETVEGTHGPEVWAVTPGERVLLAQVWRDPAVHLHVARLVEQVTRVRDRVESHEPPTEETR